MAWPGDPAINASKSATPASEPPTATWRMAGLCTAVAPAARCWMRTLGLMSSRTQSISALSSRWLTGAKAAPSTPAANSDSRNAGWFGPSHATRSPFATPSVRRPLASRRTRPASSAYVTEQSPAIRATPSGAALARRSIHEPMPMFPTAMLAVIPNPPRRQHRAVAVTAARPQP
jgi:hypothetical protein